MVGQTGPTGQLVVKSAFYFASVALDSHHAGHPPETSLLLAEQRVYTAIESEAPGLTEIHPRASLMAGIRSVILSDPKKFGTEELAAILN